LGLLYSLGVDTAKEQIYSFLKNDTPGPNFVHFPITYDQEYFRQLTAEKVVTRLSKGHPVRSWVKVYRRNEALDTFVYGYSAFLNLNPNLELLKQKISSGEHIQQRPKPKPKQMVRRSNGWVTGMNRF
jgi:phage terminase large subunit GpA-like protein